MKNIPIFFLLFLVSNYTLAQTQKEPVLKQMNQDVTYLSSDELNGRKTGTKGEKKAAKYIKAQFEKHTLSPKGVKEYYQNFTATISRNPHKNNSKKKIKGLNVIGFCDNQQKETIIIGAHYDHLGKGHTSSLYRGKNQIHNGADDNASGVSILINLIDTLCGNKLYNYLFIAFSGEEEGLLGSSFFCKNPTIDLNSIKFMLNFDMVGRLNNKRELAINGTGTSNQWDTLIEENNKFNFKLIKSESGTGPSDHTSFYLQNIPVLHFFTGQHEDYHKPTDDVEKINFQGMYSIMSYVISIIEASSNLKDFEFQETVNNDTNTPKFNVTLGIMPDYLYDKDGLRIDGVSKGKTAHKHDILKGDVIIHMGDVEITDIITYMEGLSQFQKGDTTIIKIRRDNSILEIPIVFQ